MSPCNGRPVGWQCVAGRRRRIQIGRPEPAPPEVIIRRIEGTTEAPGRLRLAVIAAAAATIVVIAGIAVLPGLFRRGEAPVGAASASTSPEPGASNDPSTGASSPPTNPVPRKTDPPPEAARRLSSALAAAARAVLPTATFRPIERVYDGRPLAAFEVVQSQGGFKAWAEIRDEAGVGQFFVYIGENWEPGNPAQLESGCPTPTPGVFCEARWGPNQEIVIILQSRTSATSTTSYQVTVVHGDGTELTAIVENFSQNDQPLSKSSKPSPQRATPPMTTEQIVEMLLRPELTLYV